MWILNKFITLNLNKMIKKKESAITKLLRNIKNNFFKKLIIS